MRDVVRVAVLVAGSIALAGCAGGGSPAARAEGRPGVLRRSIGFGRPC